MKRWILAVALLGGVALLAACTFQDFVDTISGWVDGITGGGTPGAGGAASARIELSLIANVLRGGAEEPNTPIGTVFNAVSATYDPVTRILTASWDGGDYSDTNLEIWLSPDETNIEYFYAHQIRNHSFGAWFEYFQIVGENVWYTQTVNGERYYEVTGESTWLRFDDVIYKEWSTTQGTEQDPFYKIVEPRMNGNVSSDTQSYLQIRISGI